MLAIIIVLVNLFNSILEDIKTNMESVLPSLGSLPNREHLTRLAWQLLIEVA